MEERLVILTTDDLEAAQAAQRQLTASSAHIVQRYGPHVLIVEGTSGLVKSLGTHPGVAGIYEGAVPDVLARQLDEVGRLGVAAWNERHSAAYREAKQQRKGEGLPWDHSDAEPEG